MNQERLVGQIRTVGVYVGVRRTVLNTLKRGGTEKRGGETKILKRGSSWVKGQCLKKGSWNPIMNYGQYEEV